MLIQTGSNEWSRSCNLVPLIRVEPRRSMVSNLGRSRTIPLCHVCARAHARVTHEDVSKSGALLENCTGKRRVKLYRRSLRRRAMKGKKARVLYWRNTSVETIAYRSACKILQIKMTIFQATRCFLSAAVTDKPCRIRVVYLVPLSAVTYARNTDVLLCVRRACECVISDNHTCGFLRARAHTHDTRVYDSAEHKRTNMRRDAQFFWHT